MALTVGILISGRGSNMTALIEACRRPDLPAQIGLVLSNRPDAEGLQRANAAGLSTQVIDHKAYPDRAAFDGAVDAALKAASVDLVCLAGFMRLLTADFVEAWRNRLMNIHPSLLPAFKGLDVHRRVLAAGCRVSGCTVHMVRPEMDNGPILVQAAVPVLPQDTADTLGARVLRQEHRAYPLALEMIAHGTVTVEGDEARFAIPQGDGGPESPGAAALLSPAPMVPETGGATGGA